MKNLLTRFLLFALGLIQGHKPIVKTWEDIEETLEEREYRIRALVAEERIARRRHRKWKSLHSQN